MKTNEAFDLAMEELNAAVYPRRERRKYGKRPGDIIIWHAFNQAGAGSECGRTHFEPLQGPIRASRDPKPQLCDGCAKLYKDADDMMHDVKAVYALAWTLSG